MMSNKGNAEEKIICPYDKSHHILRHRLQTHLVKCARNHPDVKILDCPYNSVHRINSPELNYHLTHCPDRMGVDKIVYKPENAVGSDVMFPVPKLDLPESECWDDGPTVPTYDPQAHCEKNAIIRIRNTQSAAKRRNFRLAERTRMQQFDTPTPSQPLGREVEELQIRRPTVQSISKQEPNHYCELRNEVAKGAGVVVTPKLPSQPPTGLDDAFNAMDINNPQPQSTLWNPKTLAQTNAPNYSAATRGIGRGSFLSR